MKKRLLSLMAAFMLLLTCAVGLSFGGEARAEETVKPIDLYLVGGQSNAAGCSKAVGVDGSFGNVMYAGEVERTLDGSGVKHCYIDSFATYPKSMKVGCGIYSDRIGPEFGIAKAINSVYAGEKKALIFKSAAGGTSLRDARTELDLTYGNWYPKSMWARGFTPDPSVGPTGVQYLRFVENFKSVYGELKANGYAPVVKGMAWMQGENDLGEPGAYEVLIKAFISDIRKDIAGITGNDDDLSMPFVIGEIATSISEYNNPLVPTFNEMQRRVAGSVSGVYTVPTADLIIVDENGKQANGDPYHFSGKDMVTLGVRFGEKLLEAADETIVELNTIGKNGGAHYKLSHDKSKITLTFSPNDGYKTSSVKVNGEEKLADVKDNVLEIATNGEKRFSITVRFAKKAALEVKLDYNREHGRAELTEETYYEGDKIAVKVTPNDGYKVKSVAIGDKPLTYNSELGNYESEPTSENCTVSVEFEAIVTEVEPEDKGGCGGKSALVASLLVVALAAVALKRG